MKTILIDGNSLIYRTFYAIREMFTTKGMPTNAIYGFMNILVKIQDEFKPDYLAVAFDMKGDTFRHKIFNDYKGGRQKMPEDLAKQFPVLKDLLKMMGIAILEKEGYEADDIIGTLAKMGELKGLQTEIITGDRDAFQLVDENITVLYTKKGITDLEIVNTSWIEEKYSLKPVDLIELKALMGDASDNIPGIAGIGEKTGIKLIKEYGNLENLYERIDELKGKQKEKLISGKDSAFLSRELGVIDIHVPLKIDYEMLSFNSLFNENSIELLKELEFKSILNRFDHLPLEQEAETSVSYEKINTEASMTRLMKDLEGCKTLSIYFHQEEKAVFLGMAYDGKLVYLNDHAVKKFRFFEQLKMLSNLHEIGLISHDLKNLLHILHHEGIAVVKDSFDILIGCYLLSPGDQQYNLKSAAFRYLEENIPDEDEFFGKGKKRLTITEISPEKLSDFIMKNCEIIMRVKPIIEKELIDTKMLELFQTIEMPLLVVMASMEELGVSIDKSALKKLAEEFEQSLEILTKEIYELADAGEFNLNSPKQLGEVLFEKIKLPVIKKTKTGYSTNIEVLEQLVNFHPMIQKIIDYRMLAKLDSTYGRGLIGFIDEESGKIFSTFNQTVAATGRISSSNPNLQNIPIKTEMGRSIRKVFIPSEKNRILVDADYSQIELRVLAHLSGDENLIDAFIKEQDIHTRTASEIFGVPLNEVNRIQRGQAKAINFGLIYGKQAFSLGKDLGISRNEAQDYIDRYFARYPKVQDYMDNIKKQAKEEGYVTTIWGRRRYIPEMNSKNRLLVQAGERMALNTPIQGSAADIIKMAMIRVYNRLREEKLDAELILQVHDELMIDTPESEEEIVKKIIKEEMEKAAQLDVPLTVDVNTGKSWFDIK
ncbi:DNA polymerase I [Eubacteriaceae bacterium ES2]|nr:DNA polymerase I [Eubacteriaceae bacterium ES2]